MTNMKNMKNHLKWLWVPVYGIVSFLFFGWAVIMNGGGHGPIAPSILVQGPFAVLEWLASLLPLGDWGGLVMYLLPVFWMGEAALALFRNKYCKWAFLIVVPAKYIVTVVSMFSDFVQKYSSQPFYEREIDTLILIGIPYIGVQALLWILFLKTWRQRPCDNETIKPKKRKK